MHMALIKKNFTQRKSKEQDSKDAKTLEAFIDLILFVSIFVNFLNL